MVFSLSIALLVLCGVLTALLAAYAAGHYLATAVFLLGRPQPRQFDDRPDDAVAVLVPARNEGERALRVIASLLEQDHAGPVEVHLLLKDANDTAIPYFRERFPEVDFSAPSAVITQAPGRSARVVFTGVDPKSDKINAVVPGLATPWVAILDCDHQAHPRWLSSSLCLLKERGARIIQGRRAPISAHGFFQLWDSLHQHIGCELFNVAFTRLGLTVFFTGTTAMMETRLLRDRPLGPCITEDADFSYSMLMKGVKVVSNPYFGSDEETSPDLYSFLARRRRWANGHTETFLRHLRQLPSAPLSPAERLQFVLHGAHYLVSLFVFALHLVIGVIFVQELSATSVAAALLSSLVLSGLVAHSQRTLEWRAWGAEVVVLFGWLAPAVVIAMNFVQAALMQDFTRAALPIPGFVQVLGLFGLCAPLIVLLVGLAGFRQLGVGSLLVVVGSWPFAFYLDLCGVLLGMADFATGRGRWRPVARGAPPATVAVSDSASLLPTLGIRDSWGLAPVAASARGYLTLGIDPMSKPSRWVASCALVALFGAGVLYTPADRIGVVGAACQVMEHDGDPWIVPASRLEGYCDPEPSTALREGVRTGGFEPIREDDLSEVDPEFWNRLDTTFFCNEAVFSPDNVVAREGGGIGLELGPGGNGDKIWSSGSIATRSSDFTYGRFEAELKPPKASGVITAFFLYRFDPWQEIDAEFLGRDPTKMLINVYYNPGEEGDLYNYGFRGTPVLVDLGFDASADFHRYAIEWEPEEIRWFVDDRLIHVRSTRRPTPIPHLPMRVHLNTWPCCSEELAGPIDPAALPASVEVRSVSLSRWLPPPITRLRSLFASGGDWRETASWIQP